MNQGVIRVLEYLVSTCVCLGVLYGVLLGICPWCPGGPFIAPRPRSRWIFIFICEAINLPCLLAPERNNQQSIPFIGQAYRCAPSVTWHTGHDLPKAITRPKPQCARGQSTPEAVRTRSRQLQLDSPEANLGGRQSPSSLEPILGQETITFRPSAITTRPSTVLTRQTHLK
jgi:hypothetical protein